MSVALLVSTTIGAVEAATPDTQGHWGSAFVHADNVRSVAELTGGLRPSHQRRFAVLAADGVELGGPMGQQTTWASVTHTLEVAVGYFLGRVRQQEWVQVQLEDTRRLAYQLERMDGANGWSAAGQSFRRVVSVRTEEDEEDGARVALVLTVEARERMDFS